MHSGNGTHSYVVPVQCGKPLLPSLRGWTCIFSLLGTSQGFLAHGYLNGYRVGADQAQNSIPACYRLSHVGTRLTCGVRSGEGYWGAARVKGKGGRGSHEEGLMETWQSPEGGPEQTAH